jgi:predicted small secreted protein
MSIKYKKNVILISLLIASTMILAGCFGSLGSGGDSDKADKQPSNGEKLSEEEIDELIEQDYDNGISFEEEDEGYKVTVKKNPGAKFVGKWEATSGNAHYLLGNLDLNVKADGTWKGNVAGDDLSGTWTEKDGGIYLKCNDPNINFGGLMVYTPDGTLIYSYYPLENSEEPNNIVLTKK